MEWNQARNETLGLWHRIRDMIDAPDEFALLTEINAMCALCDAAGELEPRDLTRCERCIALRQFGGCHEINLEMSVRIVEKDWEGLRELVDQFIHNLENLEIPQNVSETQREATTTQ